MFGASKGFHGARLDNKEKPPMHNIISAKSFLLNACGTLQELKQFLLYGMDVFRA